MNMPFRCSDTNAQPDKPAEDPKVQGDAFKTLFVSRLAYNATSEDLEREFGRYGPIERIRIVENVNASPDDPPKKRKRGYAFIVYEREKDMKGKLLLQELPSPLCLS
jgi:U1 small nuclear ribonucleoprotein